MAGVDNKPTSFLFNDTQVVDEQFLEIINNILSTGEVASLFKSDELEEVSFQDNFFLSFTNNINYIMLA